MIEEKFILYKNGKFPKKTQPSQLDKKTKPGRTIIGMYYA